MRSYSYRNIEWDRISGKTPEFEKFQIKDSTIHFSSFHFQCKSFNADSQTQPEKFNSFQDKIK